MSDFGRAIERVAALPRWNKRTVPGGIHVRLAEVIDILTNLAFESASEPPGLRSGLLRRHGCVCSCPFDGSDPDCNLVMAGTEIGHLLSSLSAVPGTETEPENEKSSAPAVGRDVR